MLGFLLPNLLVFKVTCLGRYIPFAGGNFYLLIETPKGVVSFCQVLHVDCRQHCKHFSFLLLHVF